jgi:hypothetical protein
MIHRRTAIGMAAAGFALTALGFTMNIGQASAVTPGDSSWGRGGAYCYPDAADNSNRVRYHITNIGGSPKEGTVTFDRTLEKWDDATSTYTVVNTTTGWNQSVGENIPFVVDSFSKSDAGQACANNFTVRPVDDKDPTKYQPYTGFSNGTWA